MYFAGVDIGSVAAKFIILNREGEIRAYVKKDTTPDIDALAEELRAKALQEAKLELDDIVYLVSTGYGRATVSFSQENRTEIICHAIGVHRELSSVRTIIDVGGQDSKVIQLDETGRVKNFVMNSKCSAGTGRFTEVMARALGVELEKWGEVVASAKCRAKISNICTVFAESEVISKIMQQVPLNEILAGVCESIVTRLNESVQRLGGVVPEVAFTGGVANNLGVRQILEEKVGMKLYLPKIPQSTGALGAAHIARTLFFKQNVKGTTI